MRKVWKTCAGCKRELLVDLGYDLDGHSIYERPATLATLVAKKRVDLPPPSVIPFVHEYASVCSLTCGRTVLAPGSGWEALTRDKMPNPEAVDFWLGDTPYIMQWDTPGPLPEEPTTDVERHVTRARRVSRHIDGVGTVSHLVAEYVDRLDQLRALRTEQRGAYAEMDICDDIGRIRAAMSPEDNAFAETLWWRAWPEEFAARQPCESVA